MECIWCTEEKLSHEFPSSPLTPNCNHVSAICIKCINILKNKVCGQCQSNIPMERVEELIELEKHLKCLFEEEKLELINDKKGDAERIIIRQLDGTSIELAYSPGMLISDLKLLIYREVDIPDSCQRLLYNANQLEDGNIIADYNIGPRSVIYLISLFGSVFEEQVHFLIDVSQSMDSTFYLGSSKYSRLDCVKEELERMIGNFRNEKKINLYAFGRDVKSWKPTLETCSPENKMDALLWLKSLIPRGSTNLLGALEEVKRCDPKVKCIYILSDGIPDKEQLVLDWVHDNKGIVINTTCFLGQKTLGEYLQLLSKLSGGVFRNFSAEILQKKL